MCSIAGGGQSDFVEELAFESDNSQVYDKAKEIVIYYNKIVSTLPKIYNHFKTVKITNYRIEKLELLKYEGESATNLKNKIFDLNLTIEEINNIILLTDLKKFIYNIFSLETLFKFNLVNSEIEEQNILISNIVI